MNEVNDVKKGRNEGRKEGVIYRKERKSRKEAKEGREEGSE